MQELNHCAGKGDCERSPGWRNRYHEIRGFGTASGFVRVNAARQRKSYGCPSSPASAFLQFSPTIQERGLVEGSELSSPDSPCGCVAEGCSCCSPPPKEVQEVISREVSEDMREVVFRHRLVPPSPGEAPRPVTRPQGGNNAGI